MMSRPVLLVFLLIVLIITSQFEWRQQLVPDLDATPSISEKPSQSSKREEAVKEKIILMQEKNIRRLNAVVRSLREELQWCKTGMRRGLSVHVTGIERHQIYED